ncbi:MAG TPA: iron-sulfur cluster assembly scaffold protein [Vicinamibacterales bacterium]|nr:iron-sulfur cluster assembly scaffold protein [Vicinamibacterales bacterium]
MAELPRAFKEHFDRPRRAGKLPDATGFARVENPACGDILEVGVKVVAGKLEAYRFKCHGCSSSVAAASALGELAEGKPVADVLRIDTTAVDGALGGLPQLRRHGADLAVETLAAAIADHDRKNSSKEKRP